METIHSHQFFTYLDNIWKKKIHNQFKDQWFYNGTVDDYENNDILLQSLEQRRKNYLPTTGEPLNFFNWFFSEGTQQFIEYYQNIPKLQPGPVKIKKHTNYFLEFEVIDEFNKEPRVISVEFKSELEKLFRYQVASIKGLLKQQLQNSLDFTVLQSYLLKKQSQIKDFRPYKLSEDIYASLFTSTLNNSKNELLQIVDEGLIACGYLKDESDPSALTPQEKKDLLSEIFNIDLDDNRFIEYSSHEDFVQFFLKPNERKKSAKFNLECKSNEAAIILDKMKSLGFNITYDELEKNQTFRISNNSHLTASYISKAISISKKSNSPKTLNKINAFFHELENRYIYNKGKN